MKTTRRAVLQFAALASMTPLVAKPAFAESAMDTVKSRKALRVGMAAADPWFYKDPVSEQWSGVCVEIGKMMAKHLGLQFQPVETTWANCVAAIQAEQIDVMFVLDPTPARKQAIDFPDNPLFYYAMGALIPNGAKVAAWQDLNKDGTRVGVTLGTTVDARLTKELPKAKIERFASNDESIAAFVSRRVDAVSQFHPALLVQAARTHMGEVVIPKPVTPVPTSVGLLKAQDPSFKNWVGDYIGKLYSSGQTEKLFESYMASKGLDPKKIPGLMKERWS